MALYLHTACGGVIHFEADYVGQFAGDLSLGRQRENPTRESLYEKASNRAYGEKIFTERRLSRRLIFNWSLCRNTLPVSLLSVVGKRLAALEDGFSSSCIEYWKPTSSSIHVDQTGSDASHRLLFSDDRIEVFPSRNQDLNSEDKQPKAYSASCRELSHVLSSIIESYCSDPLRGLTLCRSKITICGKQVSDFEIQC